MLYIPLWNQRFVGLLRHLLTREVVEVWQDPSWFHKHLQRLLIPQLIEILVAKTFNRRKPLFGVECKHFLKQIDELIIVFLQNLLEIPGLDGRKLVINQIAFIIHATDILNLGRAKHLDYFNQLINGGISEKNRLLNDHFNYNASRWPNVDLRCIINRPKYKFRSTVTPTADIRDIRLVFYQFLGTSKVA